MVKEIIRAENLTKNYKLGESIVHALRGVSLSINAGEFLSIIGPSGSGKTTLLNLLGALDLPTSGKVFLDGVDLTQVPERKLYEVRRNKIGFVFQHFYLIPTLTTLENVLVPVIPIKNNSRFKDRAKELFSLVGLEERMNHKPNQLSGGEQQRVAICRALINNPEVLFCDEITGELDSATGEKIVSLLKEINQKEGVTIVFVTHDPMVSSKSNRIITLIDGKITSDKTVKF
ncbi:ABC transporter ATP-binding protein [Candidatus Bathyarchaeota archaeon]|nr:MAG: ABC transporter ATP-binding protein [Candidatus Bathyarchaeota archaeon]